VAKKTAIRARHIPQRTCVGCRQVLSKKGLIRLVRTPEGVIIDPSGKAAGRGAYLHELKDCWEKGLRGPLANALKTELTEMDRARLKAYMANIPVETDITGGLSETDKKM
jgi:predicted RNA-binding protein YlxR (DUF448 family)